MTRLVLPIPRRFDRKPSQPKPIDRLVPIGQIPLADDGLSLLRFVTFDLNVGTNTHAIQSSGPWPARVEIQRVSIQADVGEIFTDDWGWRLYATPTQPTSFSKLKDADIVYPQETDAAGNYRWEKSWGNSDIFNFSINERIRNFPAAITIALRNFTAFPTRWEGFIRLKIDQLP